MLESDIPGKYMYKTDSHVTNYNMYPQLSLNFQHIIFATEFLPVYQLHIYTYKDRISRALQQTDINDIIML